MSSAPTRTVTSRRLKAYMNGLEALPKRVQETADDLFKVFCQNPDDPQLGTKKLKPSKRLPGSTNFSVQIGRSYRALYRTDKGKNDSLEYVWFWIGSHEDYNGFVGTGK